MKTDCLIKQVSNNGYIILPNFFFVSTPCVLSAFVKMSCPALLGGSFASEAAVIQMFSERFHYASQRFSSKSQIPEGLY